MFTDEHVLCVLVRTFLTLEDSNSKVLIYSCKCIEYSLKKKKFSFFKCLRHADLENQLSK